MWVEAREQRICTKFVFLSNFRFILQLFAVHTNFIVCRVNSNKWCRRTNTKKMLFIHCANSIQYIAASFLLKLCSTNSSLRTKKKCINVCVWVYKPLFMISAVVAKNEYTKRSQRILNTEIESIIMRKTVKGFCSSIPFMKHMHTFACICWVCVCVRVCVWMSNTANTSVIFCDCLLRWSLLAIKQLK